MMRRGRFAVVSLWLLVVLVAGATFPLSARADETTPTPDTPRVASPTPTETPEPTETPSLDRQELSDSTSTPTIPSEAAEPLATAEESGSEEANSEGLAASLPDDTGLLVINEDGEAVPLASNEAADILETGDPLWCPDGALPGDSACTGGYATFAGLLAYLQANSGTFFGSGTIYVEASYDSAGEGGSVVMDGGAGYGLTSLTVQGGWNGSTGGSFGLSGESTFGVPVSIIDWDYDITLNDLIFASTGATGLTVETAGNIELDNVEASGNSGDGAELDNTRGGTGVEIQVNDSSFHGNSGTGLTVYSQGDISLSNVDSYNNGGDGAFLESCDWDVNTCAGTGVVDVASSSFDSNDEWGLWISAGDDVLLQDVRANFNGMSNVFGSGAFVDSCQYFSGSCSAAGDVEILGTNAFNFNLQDGLDIYAGGDIDVSGVTAALNGEFGAYLSNADAASGDVSVSSSSFDSNTVDGTGQQAGLNIDSNGDITINKVSASSNLGGDGLDVDWFAGSFNSLSIYDSTFSNNFSTQDEWGWGLYAFNGDGNVTLGNVVASGNSAQGSNTSGGAAVFTSGGIFVDLGVFNDNDDSGLHLQSTAGSITVQCTESSDNAAYGLWAYVMDVLSLDTNAFENNSAGDYTVTGGASVVTDDTLDCFPDEEITPTPTPTPSSPTLAFRRFTVFDGQSIVLDCTSVAGTVMTLANGDRVIFNCPIEGVARLSHVDEDELPESLDTDLTFVSAMEVTLSKDLLPVETVNGVMQVDFVMLPELEEADLAILYWDDPEWRFLGGELTEDEFGEYFEAIYNKTGVFAFVSE